MLRIRPFDLDDPSAYDWNLAIFPEYEPRNDVLIGWVATDSITQALRRGERFTGGLPEMMRAALPVWKVTFWEVMDVINGRSNSSWIIARLRVPQDVLPFKQWMPKEINESLERQFMQDKRAEFIASLQNMETMRAYLRSLEQRLAASTESGSDQPA